MKRILPIVLALMLLAGALGETYVTYFNGTGEGDGSALLVRDDGSILTPAGLYAGLRPLTPEGTPEGERLYAGEPLDLPADVAADEDNYRSYTRVALVGADGAALTAFDYFELIPEGDHIIARRWPDQTDVLDKTGRVIFSASCADLRSDGAGGWMTLQREGERANEYGSAIPIYTFVALDADGTAHPTGLHSELADLQPWGEGLFAAQYVDELEGKSVFLNGRGERLFDSVYEYIGDMSDRYAVIQSGEYNGLIDRDGEAVLDATYDYIHMESGYGRTLVIAQQGGRLSFLDGDTGERLFERRFPDADYAYAWISADNVLELGGGDESELCDFSGNTLARLPEGAEVNTRYERCQGQPERLVESAGEWPRTTVHLIDLDGNPTSPEFQILNAALWKDGHGRYVTTHYDLVDDAESGSYPAWTSYRYGVCDENGETLLPQSYLSATVLDLDRYWVETPDRVGMIDGSGKWYCAVEKYMELMD